MDGEDSEADEVLGEIQMRGLDGEDGKKEEDEDEEVGILEQKGQKKLQGELKILMAMKFSDFQCKLKANKKKKK